MSTVIIMNYDKSYSTRDEVIKAWNQNATFRTPHERTSCMSKRDWLNHGNKLDSVVYVNDKIAVTVQAGLI